MKEAKASRLREVIESTRGMTEFEPRKAKVLELLETLEVFDSDKRKMKLAIHQTKDMAQLDRYLYNAMLKFEGLGVI